MARPSRGYKKLIQFRITDNQHRILTEYAASQGTTVADLFRQELKPLIVKIVTGASSSSPSTN